MRKIVVTEFISLDGIFEDPGGAEEFEHGGWTRPYWNDDLSIYKKEELFAADALLLGRVTYQGFAAAWSGKKDLEGFAERMNSLPKFVVTTTMQTVEWHNSWIIAKDIQKEITNLKQQNGQDILISGSGVLVQSLRELNLIDEYRLMVYPVILGSGTRLFKDGSPVNLKLVGIKSFSTGVVDHTYQVI